MSDFLYDQGSLATCLVLLAVMLLAMEAGHRLGRHRGPAPEALQEQVGAVQASLLGLLALMLGFTFSMALDRFDSRSEAVVAEANAIGSAWLRADLLPDSVRADSRSALRDYLALRVEAAGLAHGETAAQASLARATAAQQARLWQLAVAAGREAPNPVTTGLYLQALDDLLGAHALQEAERRRHVPALVLVLLYASFVVCGGIIGYGAGLQGQRPARVTHVMVALIALLLFLVMDLDRPRRGIVQIDTAPLLELRDTLAAPANGLPAR